MIVTCWNNVRNYRLFSLGLAPVDVPADENCFLHAARFALVQLKD